ncbi:hypothetical protein ACFWN7_15095 [Agromyces sp. NPDC058484]|uniref:hypothetical protein n=1 Tax=Agromyces sp. NPDC058484 TaxID=3346524 RepID=UPI00365CDDAC
MTTTGSVAVAAPADTRRTEPRVLSRSTTFGLVSAALVLVFASSGSPIPLYNTYRVADGIDDAALAATTVT